MEEQNTARKGGFCCTAVVGMNTEPHKISYFLYSKKGVLILIVVKMGLQGMSRGGRRLGLGQAVRIELTLHVRLCGGDARNRHAPGEVSGFVGIPG